MPRNTVFHFKQFSVNQDRCAMKITSDACIFGAWIDPGQGSGMLDIGAGTGLLSLMVAQKSESTVDALDIDAAAAEQARKNVAGSPWKKRITVINRSLQQHSVMAETKGAYDTIICNPPFYDQKLKSREIRKRVARHSDKLNLDQLIMGADYLLHPAGSLFLLLPFFEKKRLETLCKSKHLYPRKLCGLCSFENRPPHRLMAEYTRDQQPPELSQLIVYQAQNQYSADCTRLLSPFFRSLP